MASFFRRNVAQKIVATVDSLLDHLDRKELCSALSATFRLFRPKGDVPQIEVKWQDLLRIKPELETRIQPQSLYSVLKNQDFLPEYGISGVNYREEKFPSFIFSLHGSTFITKVLRETYNNFDEYFIRSSYSKVIMPQRVVIDYSSPNMAKPFHFGHFRSTILGNYLKNLFTYVGHDVVSINYIGDWGLQYGILATAFNKFGSEEKLQSDPLTHLYEVYQEGNKMVDEDPSFAEAARKHFQLMEEGAAEALGQWNRFREYTLKNLNEMYEKLGMKFDETHGESMYANQCDNLLKSLLKKNIAIKNSDGSIHTMISDDPEGKIFLRKSDNTTLYLTRDLAAAIDRQHKYHFHSMYYVVDSSQSKHFSNLFHLLKELGYSWHSNLHHVPFGLILNFSTRKGSAVFLQDVLDEAQSRTLERMENSPNTKVDDSYKEEVASALSVSALIVNDLSTHRKRNYPFLWDKILKMDGDSGIALQYCHARLNNIKENCGIELELSADLSPLVEPEALELIFQIALFDVAVWNSYEDLEPYVLMHYLFRLRRAINKANKVLTVKGQPLNIAKARLLLFHTAQLVLAQGLRIVGVTPLNKM